MVAPLTLMIGPSGCGKSSFLGAPAHSWMRSEFGIKSHHILSSDKIGEDLCVQNDSERKKVFNALYRVAEIRLAYDLPTVIDAPHLLYEDRIASATIVGEHYPVRYIVLYWNIEKRKYFSAGTWRDEYPEVYQQQEDIYQSQLDNILAGDNLPNVTVHDLRDRWNKISMYV